MPVWAAMALVLGLLGAGFALLRLYQRRFSPPPEIPRKLLHMIMGLVTLSFPWLFSEKWPVLVLAVLAEAALLAVRYAKALRTSVGAVLHDVDRDSLGELCFPVGVAAVFWLSGDRPYLYVVPVLMLTLADALAALIGIRYGQVRFATTAEPKSIEGSVAFVVAAFLSALVPLQLMTDIPRAEVLIVSLMMGLLVGLLEAVSWHGLDNLLIPLGAYTFLVNHDEAGAAGLLVRLAVLLVLVAVGLVWRRHTTLSHRGAVEASLAGYLFWVLGGWTWLLAPAALFFTYALVPPLDEEERAHPQSAEIVGSNVIVGVGWSLAAAIAGRPEWLFPFTVGFAAHAAMNSYARIALRVPRRGMAAVLAALSAWGFIIVPWVVAAVSTAGRLPLAGLAAIGCLVAAALGVLLDARLGPSYDDARRAWWQAGAAFVLSTMAWGVTTLW